MGRRTCGTREGATIWCNPDPCGVVCACITYFLVAYSQYTVSISLLLPWMGHSFFGIVHTVLFNVLACLAHASHAKAMLTDPGAVSARAEPPAADVEAAGGAAGIQALTSRRYCRKCDAYKPVRAHHCSICRRCVVKMDHHCPWINNCVGIGNHKFFIQFISYVFAISVYALALVLGRVMVCLATPNGCADGQTSVMVVLLVVEAILFGMFTMCMVCDQWEVVSTNQTQIDRLKGETHARPTEINEVFGGTRNARRIRLDCFLPTKVEFPADVWEDVMGYRCRDACGFGTEAGRMVPVTGASGRSDSDEDDEIGSGGDVEMGEFYAGPSGTVRERRQVERQPLMGRDVAGPSSIAVGNSPLRNHLISPGGAAPGGVGAELPNGVVNRREDLGGNGLP